MTLREIVTYVRDVLSRYGVSEPSLPEIVTEVNLAKDLVAKGVPVYVKRVTLSPNVAGGNEYDVPADLVKIRRVQVASTGMPLLRLNRYAGSGEVVASIVGDLDTVYELTGDKIYTWVLSLDTGSKTAADVGDLIVIYQALPADLTDSGLDQSPTQNSMADYVTALYVIGGILQNSGNPVAAANFYARAQHLMSQIPTDYSQV